MNNARLFIFIILNSISFTIQIFKQDYNSKNQCKNINILIYDFCPIEKEEESFIYDINNNINNQITQIQEINSNSKENNLWQITTNNLAEITEEQCLGKNMLKSDKKYCYIQMYSEEKNKIYFSNCLHLSKDQMTDDKYIESLIPQLYEPFIFKIKCDGYYFMKNYSPQLPKDIQCKDIKQPLFKEQCNSIKISNSEYQCCYIETKYDSKIEKECVEFDSELLKIEEDFYSYIKFDFFYNISVKNISNYDSIMKEFSSNIPNSKSIKCNTYTKIIDNSRIKLTRNDIMISKKHNFCPFIDVDENITGCFNGLLFSDFIRDDGQCCYFEIKSEKNTVHKQCIPLTKYSRENYYFLDSLVELYNTSGHHSAKVICNGFKSAFDSSKKKWTKISNY